MSTENLSNDFQTKLAAPIADAVTTSISVVSAVGAPAANFRIRIDDEDMLVTSVGAGTNWTVTRGIEGTTAVAHSASADVVHVLTALGLLQFLNEKIAAATVGLAVAATTLAGYGITDAYTKTQADARYAPIAVPWASVTGTPTTLGGYGITDAYTKTAADARYAPIAVPWNTITGTPTTVAGYGIADVYTKTVSDGRYLQAANNLSDVANVATARHSLALDTGDSPTFKGLTLTAGSVAVSTPFFSATQTWNGSGITFTGMKVNVTDTLSAATSLLLDLQVASASVFSIRKDGALLLSNGSAASPAVAFSANAGDGLYRAGNGNFRLTSSGADVMSLASAGVTVASTGQIAWGSSGIGSPDVTLFRDAANILALRNGVNAQGQRIYNSFTDASNYGRGFVGFSSNFFTISVEAAGTGGSVAHMLVGPSVALGTLYLQSANVFRWRVDGSTGSFIAHADNSFDIGAAGATRPRNLFVAGAICPKVKAGVPVDGDFTNPTDGMICIDSTDSKIYVRIGGLWKGALLS